MRNLKYVLIFLFFLSASCSHLKRKPQDPQSKQKFEVEEQVAQDPEELEEPQEPEAIPKPVAPPKKLGLILGPGGLRAFAHVGVLKALNEARIPIHAIVGLEWGALPAALYSLHGKVNEVEWKMGRLKEEDLPDSRFFSKKISTSEISKLDEFLNLSFESIKVTQAELRFSCPSLSLKRSQVYWLQRDRFVDVMRKCMALPPLYKDYQGFVAAPFSFQQAIKKLRELGANYIVYVDLLNYSDAFIGAQDKVGLVDRIYWSQLKAAMDIEKMSVDKFLAVPGLSGDILSFNKRQEFVSQGYEKTKSIFVELSEETVFSE